MTLKQKDLVEQNMALAYDITNQTLRKFNKVIVKRKLDPDDVESAAFLGLCKAANSFNESKEFKFSTYAYRCIYNEIDLVLRKIPSDVPVSLDKIYTNSEGVTYTRLDFIEAPKSNFEESTFDEDMETLVNTTLNSTKRFARIVLLYRFSGMKHKNIASILHSSKTYVSYVARKKLDQIKLSVEENQKFEQTFNFEIFNGFYYLEFFKEDVPFWKEILQNLGASPLKINQEQEKITLSVIAELDSFKYLANFFQEFELQKEKNGKGSKAN